jgi:hypothetical protein
MFNSTSRKTLATLGTTLVLMSLATAAHADRTRSSTRTFSNGQSVQRQAAVKHSEPGSVSRSRSVQGSNGKMATSEFARNYDASTQTLSRDRVVTGPNGQTASRNSDVMRTENGATRDVVRTGPEGKTVASHGEIAREGNTVTGSRTVTGPEGATVSRDGIATYDAATQTLTQTRITTVPEGETSTKTTTRTVGQP